MMSHCLYHFLKLTALQVHVCERHSVFSCVFVFSAELLSSNKKYGVKQRQYKLFAGEFGYFGTDQAHHLYLFPDLFVVWLCCLCFIKRFDEILNIENFTQYCVFEEYSVREAVEILCSLVIAQQFGEILPYLNGISGL